MSIISRVGGAFAAAAIATLAACSGSVVGDDWEDGSGENAIPWERLEGTLLVTSVSATGAVDLRLVDARQRTVRTVATGVTARAGPSGAVFSLAPDLQSVAYAEADLSAGTSDLRSIPIGSDPVDCSASCGEPLVVTENWEWGPAWSRDGRLAYNAVRSETSGIVVDGEPAHGDSLFSRDFVRPAWAPDGTLVAPLTLLTLPGGYPDLYRLDPETRSATLIMPDVWLRQLQGWAVSPTDGRLAYSSDQDGAVWIADPDGQNAVEVAAGYGPVWSPDGSQIAFADPALDEGTGERLPALYVVDVPGGTPVLVLSNATVRDWR